MLLPLLNLQGFAGGAAVAAPATRAVWIAKGDQSTTWTTKTDQTTTWLAKTDQSTTWTEKSDAATTVIL